MEIKKPLPVWFLIACLIVLSVGAIGGGLVLALDPTGGGMGMQPGMLAHGPFPNFFVPGVFLFFVLGVLPLVSAFGLLKKFNFPLAERINVHRRQHWSWTASFYSGIILVLWIDIQVAILRSLDVLHLIYSVLGIVIVLLAVWPTVMAHFEEKS